MSRARACSEVGSTSRPSLSTFGINHIDGAVSSKLDHHHSGHPISYASLRRGSSSKLMAVPSPTVSMSLGMNSLPRHAFRNNHYSSSLSSTSARGFGNRGSGDDFASLTRPSRRKSSRPGTPPPSTVTDCADNLSVRPSMFAAAAAASVNQKDSAYPFSVRGSSTPTYFTFHGSRKPPPILSKKTGTVQSNGSTASHLLPAR